MKYLSALFALMMFMTAPVVAASETLGASEQPAESQATPPTMEMALCAAMGTVAASVMGARQRGVDMIVVMDAILISDEQIINDFVRHFIIEAYRVPQFSGEDYRQEAVHDFRTSVLVQCFKA